MAIPHTPGSGRRAVLAGLFCALDVDPFLPREIAGSTQVTNTLADHTTDVPNARKSEPGGRRRV